MLQQVIAKLKALWQPLVVTDLLFKAIAFILLLPAVGLLFRGFLALSGRQVLADADIARFLLHPIGWMTIIIVGGAAIGVVALELSAIMTISLTATHAERLKVPSVLKFISTNAPGLIQLTGRMVLKLLVLAAPFLAVGGGLYVLLLTKHDINFYLTEKPPVFWLAVGSIGTVLVAMACLLVRAVINWSVAIPLHLFENMPPSACLDASRTRVFGQRKTITRWIVGWWLINAVVSFICTAVVLSLGRFFVPAAAANLVTLVFVLGLVLLVWGIINTGLNLLAMISLAVLQTEIYEHVGKGDEFSLPVSDDSQNSHSFQIKARYIVAVSVIGVLIAGLIGIAAIHTVRLEDDVQITAHRGASGKAPENTMAAVRQAIEDGTDWVEIDVQETKDGIVVVAHDSDLKKVSGVNTKIWEGTAAELQAVDIGSYFGPEFADERVPTLADVLQECRDRAGVVIELKYYGHDQNLEQKVVDLVEEHQMESQVLIMSLEAKGIAKIRKLRPDWTIGLLTAVVQGDLTKVDADFLAVNTGLAKRRFITAAHSKNKKVFVWTVNDPVTMSQMISRGADTLITDYPDVARKVLQDRSGMSPVQRVLVEIAFLFGSDPPPMIEQ